MVGRRFACAREQTASVLVLVFICLLTACALQPTQTASAPLVVNQDSEVVVMEYENWFGPKARNFQTTPAMPMLQSPDMQALGGGYDSADPAVVATHARWFESMGVDAALIEVTNNVSCIFNSDSFAQQYLPYCSSGYRSYNQVILSNTGNTYPAWTELGTPLKLIALVGGIDPTILIPDADGKTAFEKEVEYFGTLMAQYPALSVNYQGKPLMLIFIGAGQDPNTADNPLWFQYQTFLNAHPELTAQYTFRLMAGYLESQSDLWMNQGVPTGPVEINPAYGFWSWVDRLNPTCTLMPDCPYYPSYNVAGSRVENLTVSIATKGELGWGCPNSEALPYCPDAALRFGTDNSYATFAAFMNEAAQLDPIFLIIHQFNEFFPPDEGFDADTDDDIEPADLWGNDLSIVQQQISSYRRKTKIQWQKRASTMSPVHSSTTLLH